jgi:hypothetical protein
MPDKDDKIVDLGKTRQDKLAEELMKEARKPKPWQTRLNISQKNIRFDGSLLGEPSSEKSVLAIVGSELDGEQRVISSIKMTKAQWRELIKTVQPFLDHK